ncbi:hypothetical protein [Paraburkholderia kururiensis]|uniref:hypothetical protein n=1 Tax=Paraburkholderia kururiensis TaxID=984307 RepID=UPI001386E796|nr:hypothetical protein [Paraburkholderia kururiensis]
MPKCSLNWHADNASAASAGCSSIARRYDASVWSYAAFSLFSTTRAASLDARSSSTRISVPSEAAALPIDNAAKAQSAMNLDVVLRMIDEPYAMNPMSHLPLTASGRQS